MKFGHFFKRRRAPELVVLIKQDSLQRSVISTVCHEAVLVYSNEAKHSMFAQAGRKRAIENFTIDDKIVTDANSTYQKVLERPAVKH